MNESVYDKINAAISPTLRKINDIIVSLEGTKTKILKIRSKTEGYASRPYNVYGDASHESYGEAIDQVIIKYPFSQTEIFSQQHSQTNSFELFEILPIEMVMPFKTQTNLQNASPENTKPTSFKLQ